MKIDDFGKWIYDDLSLKVTKVVMLIVHKSAQQQRFGNLK